MLDLKAVEERPEGLVPGPPQAMSVPHLPFAIQTIAVFVECFFFFLKKEKKFLTDAGLRVRE
jgi:hypothetical protein